MQKLRLIQPLQPHLLLARDVELRLRYIDLWRAWRGQPLRIEQLRASRLVTDLERLPALYREMAERLLLA